MESNYFFFWFLNRKPPGCTVDLYLRDHLNITSTGIPQWTFQPDGQMLVANALNIASTVASLSVASGLLWQGFVGSQVLFNDVAFYSSQAPEMAH